MKQKKKIGVIVSGLVLLLLISGLAFVGNYFFNYALVRQEGIITAAGVDPNAPQSVETEQEKNK